MEVHEALHELAVVEANVLARIEPLRDDGVDRPARQVLVPPETLLDGRIAGNHDLGRVGERGNLRMGEPAVSVPIHP